MEKVCYPPGVLGKEPKARELAQQGNNSDLTSDLDLERISQKYCDSFCMVVSPNLRTIIALLILRLLTPLVPDI